MILTSRLHRYWPVQGQHIVQYPSSIGEAQDGIDGEMPRLHPRTYLPYHARGPPSEAYDDVILKINPGPTGSATTPLIDHLAFVSYPSGTR